MLRPMLIEPVPYETVRVAQAAFPKSRGRGPRVMARRESAGLEGPLRATGRG
jgi:hypothetical protein